MERISKVRAMVFLSIFLLVFVLYAAKLFDLQIIETKGDTNNMTTYTSLTRVKAARGDILDKNGNLLVSNRASYNLIIINIPGFGDIGNGYRTAGFQIYTMLLAISSVGIPNAISKMVSEKLYIIIGQITKKIKNYVQKIMIFVHLELILVISNFIIIQIMLKNLNV